MTGAVAEPQATDHPVGSDAEQVIVEALLLLRGHLEGAKPTFGRYFRGLILRS
jgi:hypothetical protein